MKRKIYCAALTFLVSSLYLQSQEYAPADWENITDGYGGSGFVQKEIKKSGEYTIAFKGKGQQSYCFFAGIEWIPVDTDSKYVLKAWVKSDNTRIPDGTRLGYYIYNKDREKIGQSFYYYGGNFDWKEVKETISFPKNTAYFRPVVGIYNSGENCYFDNVFFAELGSNENLLKDGGFENIFTLDTDGEKIKVSSETNLDPFIGEIEKTASDAPPKEWVQSGKIKSSKFFIRNKGANASNTLVLINYNQDSQVFLEYPPIPAKAGEKCILSVMTRSIGKAKRDFKVYVHFLDAEMKKLSDRYDADCGGSHDWSRYTIAFKTPEKTAYILLQIGSYGSSKGISMLENMTLGIEGNVKDLIEK